MVIGREYIMSIKFVELIGDYDLKLNSDGLYMIKSNNIFKEYIKDYHEIDEFYDELSICDFIEICKLNNIDFEKYISKENLIEIGLSDTSKFYITNFDIARIWDWHDYCEGMDCYWHDQYIMFTASDCSGQCGVVGIWDISKESWIWSSKDAGHIIGMIYIHEIERFIYVYDEYVWGCNSFGICLIDPNDSFRTDHITFELHRIKSDENNRASINEIGYKCSFGIDKLRGKQFSHFILNDYCSVIFDKLNKYCYIHKYENIYKYSFM